MFKIRKTPEGNLEGLLTGTHDITFLSKTELLVSQIELTVWHFLTHEPGRPVQSLYLFNRMVCSQYLSPRRFSENVGFWDRDRDGDGRSVKVFDNQPHILGIPDVTGRHASGIRHADLDGRDFGGSNTRGSGELCLGTSYNPFSLDAVDGFINNRANSDLNWVGPKMKVIDSAGYTTKAPILVEWPATSHRSCLQIPQGIREFFNR